MCLAIEIMFFVAVWYTLIINKFFHRVLYNWHLMQNSVSNLSYGFHRLQSHVQVVIAGRLIVILIRGLPIVS